MQDPQIEPLACTFDYPPSACLPDNKNSSLPETCLAPANYLNGAGDREEVIWSYQIQLARFHMHRTKIIVCPQLDDPLPVQAV